MSTQFFIPIITNRNTILNRNSTIMFTYCIYFIGVLFIFIIIRLGQIKLKCFQKTNNKNIRTIPARTMIILGSGGHTAEMLTIVKELNSKRYNPRIYVLADSDITSENKISNLIETATTTTNYEIIKIYRSRHVGQSYLSSILTTLYSVLTSFSMVYQQRPELILCNGPGTCVPICIVAFALRLFLINTKCKIVFIESFCRVKTLSLTGKILLWIADKFVVNWPIQQKMSSTTEYYGQLF